METYTLHSVKAWGGAIPQIVLAMSGLPHETRFHDPMALRESPEYGRLNPLRQVPTLELPNGQIMTESLAICTYLCEKAGVALVPPAHAPERAHYLRWSTFLVASIYPTFTVADDPKRWVTTTASQEELRKSIAAFREGMWRNVEAAAAPKGDWFLGERQSLIDVYLSIMTLWTPRWEWFEAQTPRLAEIARRFRDTEVFRKVFAANS